MWMWQETLLQNFVKFGVNLTFFAPRLPWQQPPFWIFFNPQKLPHTTVDIPTKFHELWWKESNYFFNAPFFVSMATAEKFVQPIPIFLAYLVPLDVVLFLSSFINFCSASNLLWLFLCFFNFLAYWPFPWQRQPFWKKSTSKGTTSHGIWYSYKVS